MICFRKIGSYSAGSRVAKIEAEGLKQQWQGDKLVFILCCCWVFCLFCFSLSFFSLFFLFFWPHHTISKGFAAFHTSLSQLVYFFWKYETEIRSLLELGLSLFNKNQRMCCYIIKHVTCRFVPEIWFYGEQKVEVNRAICPCVKDKKLKQICLDVRRCSDINSISNASEPKYKITSSTV